MASKKALALDFARDAAMDYLYRRTGQEEFSTDSAELVFRSGELTVEEVGEAFTEQLRAAVADRLRK